jgi:hypothetical protein
MPKIARANPYLDEIIEDLERHRAKYRSDDEARAYLSKDDNEWIDQEILTSMMGARYFISNYYAYRDEKEGFKGLYPLFDSQEILHDEYRRLERERGRVRALVLKARQMGSTTYNVAEFFHKTMFAEHINAIIVGQDEDAGKYFMGMYESALDYIPWWMRPRVKQRNAGSLINFDEKDENLRQTRPGLKTWIYADNARKPSGVGRSKTFGRAMLSELAFWDNGSQLSKALFPTFNTPDGFYIMESTANGRNDFWHNLWRRAESGKVDWEPIFIPFYRRAKTYSIPILKTEVFVVTGEELEMRERIFKKESFLISDDTFKWMRNKKEEFVATDGDDMMFSQEYTSEAEESFQSSAITAFPRGIINRFSKRTYNPKWFGEITYDFDLGRAVPVLQAVPSEEDIPYPVNENRFHVFERPEKGEKYCVGVDVSLGNDGGDYSCIQVVRLTRGKERDKQVACWHGYINPNDLAEIVLAVCWWYEEAMAAVEVNSMGMVTNSALLRSFDYENVYRFKRLDRLKHAYTDIVGWWTDYKSKRALITKMDKVLRDDAIEIPCRFTMDEFRDFTAEDGAVGEGAHDDFLMALMIALYCGHEGEDSERRGSRPLAEIPNVNRFKVYDRNNVLQVETTSQNQAEAMSRKIIGSRIERIMGATATLQIGQRKLPVPADFQNTAHSPIHDKDGIASRLHYEEGIPEELITPEMVAQFEESETDMESDSNSWLYN